MLDKSGDLWYDVFVRGSRAVFYLPIEARSIVKLLLPLTRVAKTIERASVVSKWDSLLCL